MLLFISHVLVNVARMTHRVAAMYLGKIVEMAGRQQIFTAHLEFLPERPAATP